MLASFARTLIFAWLLLAACSTPGADTSDALGAGTAGTPQPGSSAGANSLPVPMTAGAMAQPPAAGAGGAGRQAPMAGATGQSDPGSAGSEVPAVGMGGGGASAPGSGACGSAVVLQPHPFGCSFAWGANGNEGGRDDYLDFITTWVGYEWTQNRAEACDGCSLAAELSSKDAVAIYYAYFIGSVLPDCNENPNGPNLCTDGAQYIRDNRQRILDIYGWYAEQTYRASPNKGVVWLLEGDFMQYAEPETQSAALSITELGELARELACAIRANAPNAQIAINHITWNADEETDAYWQAMPLDAIDFVWTTGVGNNAGFFSAETNAASYNGRTATYRYVHELTGKPIWVDTSFGLSQQADSWTTASTADLDARIAEGVFAVNVTTPPADYQNRLSALRSALEPVCR